jgi:hypothetical protein
MHLFKKTEIFFLYDKSDDNTLFILNDFKNQYDNINIFTNTKKRSIYTTENICNARNSLLDIIRSYHISVWDYFIMMDCNEYSCIGNINIQTLNEVFCEININKWDAVSFDREAGYYDIWALSFGDFIYSFFHFNKKNTVYKNMKDCFENLLLEYKNKYNEFIPVYSAFNGFAIYKKEKFIDCSYSTRIDIDLFPPDILLKQQKNNGCQIINYFENDCEHRHFHLQAFHKGAKIMIYPRFVFHKISVPDPSLRGPA